MINCNKYRQPVDFFPLIPVYAFSDAEKCIKYVKERTGLDYTIPNIAEGHFSYFENDKDGQIFSTIYINTELDTYRRYSVIAHECVHYMQAMEDFMSTRFDRETEAYVVQSCMMSVLSQIS